MATKKRRPAKPKRAPGKKPKLKAPKQVAKKRAAKKPISKRTVTKAGAVSKKSVVKKKTQARKKAPARKKPIRRGIALQTASFERSSLDSRSEVMSGDLQGLRETEVADSESVTELLEEGNALEAGIVAGVEQAEDEPEREVHSLEVPEDDVPEEYQDEEG